VKEAKETKEVKQIKPAKGIIDKEELAPGDYSINRELSWLAFNTRVLEEAHNRDHPLLERLRFLSISDSNLDEFYMVRVAAYKSDLVADITKTPSHEQGDSELLRQIALVAGRLIDEQTRTWRNSGT
jgi:polyphosphate kinase